MNRVLIYDVPNWLRDNQTIVGCVIIGISTVCLALAGILKSKGDKAAASRKKEENGKSKRIYVQYAFSLLVCGAWTFYGTLLTKHAADKAAQDAVKIQQETNEKVVVMERKFGEKIQAVLVRLNAAKQEDSKKITDEKIRALKSDFSQWAEDFATNLPAEKSKFAQLKNDLQNRQAEAANKEAERQKQISGQLFPIYSFAIKFLQESVRAYAAKTGNTNAVIEPFEFPENFYGKPIISDIHFTNAVWKLSIRAGFSPHTPYAPGYDINKPFLGVTFFDAQKKPTGEFYIRINQEGDKMRITYVTSLPAPDPETINGEFDLSDYEGMIKIDLQRIIKAQLLQLED